MSVESHLRESMLKTALLHLLKHQKNSPDRTARNIQELLNRFPTDRFAASWSYEELLEIVKNGTRDECLDWVMRRIS